MISTSISLDFDDLAASVSRPHDLQPLADHLAKQRAAAHRALKRSLRSKRFSDLCRSWRAELGAVISAPAPRRSPPPVLADHRLHRTYRKVTKRARAINAASPSEEIHALRKACKEMRYLLDVFKPLCDPQAYRKVIADFKQLQDILGDFQDGEVQANALHALRRGDARPRRPMPTPSWPWASSPEGSTRGSGRPGRP